MNPSTKLVLDEMRRLFAEHNAWLDWRFADLTTSVASTLGPSATPLISPAPSSTASVAPAATPSAAASATFTTTASIAMALAPSAALSVAPVATPSTDSTLAPSAPPGSPMAAPRTPCTISFELVAPPHSTDGDELDLHDGAVAGPVRASLGFLPDLRGSGLQGTSSFTSTFSPPLSRSDSTSVHLRTVMPTHHTDGDRRGREMPHGSDVELDLHDFLGDAHGHTASRLAATPFSTRPVTMQPSHNFILIREPFLRGEHLVKSLHLDASIPDCMRNPYAMTAVLVHGKHLWWLALPYEVSSTLSNRCLMNCLTIIPRCCSLPFSCSWDAVLCWQHRLWPPPSELWLVSYEAKLRPLPCMAVVQHGYEVLGHVSLWPTLETPMVCINSASILSKLKLVHHGSYSDKGVSRVPILVHHSIAYQPWHSDQMVICRISGATTTYLEMSEHMTQVGTVCSPCFVDVVDFGKSNDEKPEKLETLVAAVHSDGLAQYLVDKSIQSYFSPSWDAVLYRPPWPPSMQFEIESDGAQFSPMPWPSFGCLTVRCHTCFLHKYLMWLLCCDVSEECLLHWLQLLEGAVQVVGITSVVHLRPLPWPSFGSYSAEVQLMQSLFVMLANSITAVQQKCGKIFGVLFSLGGSKLMSKTTILATMVVMFMHGSAELQPVPRAYFCCHEATVQVQHHPMSVLILMRPLMENNFCCVLGVFLNPGGPKSNVYFQTTLALLSSVTDWLITDMGAGRANALYILAKQFEDTHIALSNLLEGNLTSRSALTKQLACVVDKNRPTRTLCYLASSMVRPYGCSVCSIARQAVVVPLWPLQYSVLLAYSELIQQQSGVLFHLSSVSSY